MWQAVQGFEVPAAMEERIIKLGRVGSKTLA